MKLNIYEYEIVVRKRVKIAARDCHVARQCAEGREEDAPESVTLASVQENVDVATMTAEVVDCITCADATEQAIQQITAPDRLPQQCSDEQEGPAVGGG